MTASDNTRKTAWHQHPKVKIGERLIAFAGATVGIIVAAPTVFGWVHDLFC